MNAAPTLRGNRQWWWLWTTEAVSQFGSSVSWFAFGLVTFSMTGSGAMAGLVTASYTVAWVVTGPFAGVVIDRHSRRAIMRISSLVDVVIYLLLGWLVATGRAWVPALAACSATVGASMAFYRPASAALVRDIIPVPLLPAATSLRQARGQAADLIGPPAGGLLLGIGRAWPFLVDALSCVIQLVGATAVHDTYTGRSDARVRKAQTSHPSTRRREFTEGWRFIAAHPYLRAVLQYAMIQNFAFLGFFTVLEMTLLQRHWAPAEIGAIGAVMSAAGLLGATFGARATRKVRGGQLAIGSSILNAAVLTVVAVAHLPFVILCAALFVGTVLDTPANAVTSAYLQHVTPREMQGRVNTSQSFAATALQPLAPTLGGFLLDALGSARTLITFAGLTIVGALILTSARSIRSLPAVDEWETA